MSHPTNTRNPGDAATLGEILAAQLAKDHAAQWQLPAVLQRHEAEKNTSPRHWRMNPETHKLEEVKP